MTDTFQFGPTKGGEPWREEEEGGIRPSIGSGWSSLRGPDAPRRPSRGSSGRLSRRSATGSGGADLDAGLRSDGLTTEAREEMRRLKRDVKRLRMERDILKKAAAWFARESGSIPAGGMRFMKAHRAMFPARGHVPGAGSLHQRVPRLAAPPALGAGAARARNSRGRIMAAWIESGGIYGCPRIHAALRAGDERVGRKRVARLMRELGIEGVTRRRFRTGTTRRDAGAKAAPDLVNRDFSARAPTRLWVADITQVRTWSGWLYLAVVLDVWSRRIVGWAMDTRMPAELVGDALAMAITTRQPEGPVIHHSDRGSQYTSLAFGQRCREAGVVRSMGSVGDAYDNAMCESFFATLECELIDRRRFRTVAEARREVFSFIEGFYNTRRLHSALGYRSPANFEKLNHAA